MGTTLAVIAFSAMMAGCTQGRTSGSLRAVSMTNDPVEFRGEFVASFFSHDQIAGTSFMLSSVDPDRLMKGEVENAQVLHVELLWEPRAGFTPIDPAATNASIRYVVISNGEMGIYGGAGFAWPDGSLTDSSLYVSIEEATLQLQEKTAGFHDLLGVAYLEGSFNAVRDERKTRQLNYAASQLVTNALGRSRFVRDDFEIDACRRGVFASR